MFKRHAITAVIIGLALAALAILNARFVPDRITQEKREKEAEVQAKLDAATKEAGGLKSLGAKIPGTPIGDGRPDDAPEAYYVRFKTTKGEFFVEVITYWEPRAAQQFYELVRRGGIRRLPHFSRDPGFCGSVWLARRTRGVSGLA